MMNGKPNYPRNIRPAMIAGLLTVLITALSGCGPNTTYQLPPDYDFGGGPLLPGGSGPGSGSGSGSSPGSTITPAMSFSFSVTGAGGSKPNFSTRNNGAINTNSLLKVRVNAGGAGQLSLSTGYSNFTASYTCIRYRVKLLNYNTGAQIGSDQVTSYLGVWGGGPACPGAASNQVFDLSSYMTPGHGPVAIQIQAEHYDFYYNACLANPWMFSAQYYGCNMYIQKTIYATHTVTGSMDIQVNGTGL